MIQVFKKGKFTNFQIPCLGWHLTTSALLRPSTLFQKVGNPASRKKLRIFVKSEVYSNMLLYDYKKIHLSVTGHGIFLTSRFQCCFQYMNQIYQEPITQNGNTCTHVNFFLWSRWRFSPGGILGVSIKRFSCVK